LVKIVVEAEQIEHFAGNWVDEAPLMPTMMCCLLIRCCIRV